MGKRTSNSTRYMSRERKLYWRVEWNFVSAAARCVDEKLDENTVLHEALARHVQYKPGTAEKHHALREHADAGVDVLIVLMRKERMPVSCKFPLQSIQVVM